MKKRHISEISVDQYFKTSSSRQQRSARNSWEYASQFISKTERKKHISPDEIREHIEANQDIFDEDGDFDEVFLDETKSEGFNE